LPNYNIKITRFAEQEYALAYVYYESVEKGLGNEFEKQVDSIITHIKSNPHLFQRKFKHYREALLKKFPYFHNKTVFRQLNRWN